MRSLAVIIALLAVSALPLSAQDVVVGNIPSNIQVFEPPPTPGERRGVPAEGGDDQQRRHGRTGVGHCRSP